jgi:hypothetical protein
MKRFKKGSHGEGVERPVSMVVISHMLLFQIDYKTIFFFILHYCKSTMLLKSNQFWFHGGQ